MRLSFIFSLALALAISAIGCPCARSAINANEGLRWWLFSNFGASKICPEMAKRGVPLKMSALGTASVGRFFPQTCNVRVDDANRAVITDVSGTGYAFLPVARRVGFYCRLSIEFKPDFRLEEDSMYVWGKFSRMVAPPELRLIGVENSVINIATQTPLGQVGTVIGQGVVTSEVSRGFTVVRHDDGDDFTLGILTPPSKPKRYFKAGDDHVILATDVTEIHAASREYLGPFAIEGNDAALFVKMQVTGANLDVILVDKTVGDLWKQAYEQAQPIGPPPGPTLAYFSAPAGQGVNKNFPVRPGYYYVVVENRAPAPLASIGMAMPFEQVGYLTYSVEVGEKP